MARNLKTVEIKLPFSGFYESLYSGAIDSREESFVEYRTTEEGDDSELNWPEDLRIDASDLASILFDVTDYPAAYDKLARAYVDAFSQLAGDGLGISAPEQVKFYDREAKGYKTRREVVSSLRLTFADMSSPREYNFTTDRIFANVPVSVVRKLWAIVKADSFDTLTRVAQERHCSRSGFISGYRSDWRDWGALADWDHNQLETLLIAACEVERFDWEDSDLAIYYATTESETDYQAWESAVDWQRFDEKRNAKRVELMRDWLEEDSDAARAWIGNNGELSDSLILSNADEFAEFDLADIQYRCPLTSDLFAES